MKQDYIKSGYEFEKEMVMAITSACSPRELKGVNDSQDHAVWDMVLPNGCAKLNIKGPAIIEFKYNLGTAITRVLHYIESKLQENHYVYIIYLNISIPEEYVKKLESKSIFFLPAKSILKKTKPIERKQVVEDEYPKLRGSKTLFVGAGVGISSGLPAWDELLKNMENCIQDPKIKEIVSKIRDNNLIIKSRKIITILQKYEYKHEYKYKYEPEFHVYELIKEALYLNEEKESHLLNTIISLIQNKQIDTIVTYNYDDLIERKLESYGTPVFPVLEGDEVMQRDGVPILHVHGYIPKSKKPTSVPHLILEESSYNRLFNESYRWVNVEQLHYMRSTNCIFVGFSMQDPNLRRLLELANGDGSREHCIFLKEDEHGNTEGEKESTCIIMSRLGLKVIWFNEYEELPSKLKDLFTNQK